MSQELGGVRPPAPALRGTNSPTALPRWITAIIVGAIALASAAALVWPSLPFNRQTVADSDIGVISAQIEAEGMGGRISATAPDFAYIAPGGKTVRLSDYRGKS